MRDRCRRPISRPAAIATLLVSTDPAESLAPCSGVTLRRWRRSKRRRRDWRCRRCSSIRSRHERRSSSRWRESLITIVDRGTYLDVEDIDGLVDASHFLAPTRSSGCSCSHSLLTPDAGSTVEPRSSSTRRRLDTRCDCSRCRTPSRDDFAARLDAGEASIHGERADASVSAGRGRRFSRRDASHASDSCARR